MLALIQKGLSSISESMVIIPFFNHLGESVKADSIPEKGIRT